MKKLSLLLLIAIPVLVKAQSVTLKATGFVDAVDSTKNYTVIDFPKMNKSELYKKTLTYLNSIYKNPAAVLSTVNGESITVNGETDELKTKLYWYKYDYQYNIVLRFKDGKIRYEPRFIKLIEVPNPSPATEIYLRNTDSGKLGEINCIFIRSKKDGLYYAFKEDIQIALSNWANNYLSDLKNSLSDNW